MRLKLKNLNILRNSLEGRIWKAYGEDPLLSGEGVSELLKEYKVKVWLLVLNIMLIMKLMILDVILLLIFLNKHFGKFILKPFYKPIKKGDVASIMESYNTISGTLMTKNKRLLQEILKDKILFDDFVMSDWWAINSDSYEHFGNGCDMNMPGWTKETGTMTDGNWWKEIANWIKQGILLKIELMMYVEELL